MTNQEAAEMIRNDMKLHHDYLSGEYRKALKMAISALQMQDSKTRSCDTCKHNPVSKKWPCVDCDMREPADRWEPQEVKNSSDLISRQAAIDVLCNGNCHEEGRSCDDGDCPVVREIKALPSAQPDNRLEKIADLVEGTIDHFDRDDAMDLLYQIKEVFK